MITKACQVANRSEIIVLHSPSKLDLIPTPETSVSTFWDYRRVLAVYSPSHKFANELIISSKAPFEQSWSSTTTGNSVSVMKYATGKGDIDGGVKIELCNNLNFPIRIVLLESAPWYAEMYFSSLSITLQSGDNNSSQVDIIPGNS